MNRPQPLVGAAGQVDRLLRLVPMLHGTRELRIADAAGLLGVSQQQVVKDLKVLLMCGLPGGYPDDLIDVDLDALEGPGADGVIRVSNADYLARPVRLAPVEASALAVALGSLGAVDPGAHEVVQRTLAKLELVSNGPAPMFAVPGEADLRSAWTRALDQAIRADRQVRLDYWVATRDELTTRVVDPHQVETEDGLAYLRAWCHRAQEPRSFRLDRVLGLSVLDQPRTRPVPSDHQRAAPTLVRLVLGPAAAWFPRYYRVDLAEELADGSVRVQLQVWDLRWLDPVLLRLAPHVRSVNPPEVADRALLRIEDVLALYPESAAATATDLD